MTRTISPRRGNRRTWARRTASVVVLLATCAPGAVAGAATLPPGFVETRIASGLTNPTAMALAPDGRLFVCEQGGSLRVIKGGSLLPAPFVSLTVDSSGERGLLGVAFDPGFAANQHVYVYYTLPVSPRRNRVSRFTASGDVAQAGSELVILELDDLSSATNHNGGAIHFGPDGKLYVAVGDNANGANAQSLNTRHGKMLRLGPDGSVPTDNPFYAQATGANRAIWALGLRNPFTFTFQRGTGRMFINDVGQNAWEEINDGMAGANYGWPSSEGPPPSSPDPAITYPLHSYGHGSGATTGCAVTGGAFYNPASASFPAESVGKFYFADYCSGWIRRFDPDTGLATGFAAGISLPVDLLVSPAGDLYYLARGSGDVWRISYPPGPGAQPPLADLDGDGRDDVLWREQGGALYAWLMNGTSLGAGSASVSTAGPDWQAKAVADFDGDGRGDVLWRHRSGTTYLWFLSGASVTGRSHTSAQADNSWRIEGVDDFDGNGRADILWRDASGALYLWLMSGATVTTVAALPSVDLAWQVQATADFSGDGKADILWRHAASGATYAWLLSGSSVIGQGHTTAQAANSWQIRGAGDVDGDGKSDLVWRHPSGLVYLWLMNGTGLMPGSGALPPVDASWALNGVGDLDGDGRGDLLWRESASGGTFVWFLNGATVVNQGFTSGQAAPNWNTQPPSR